MRKYQPVLILAVATLLCAPLATAETLSGPLPKQVIVDYQLGGAYPPPKAVTVVVRDSMENPAPGLFNICYVNGFQSQPNSSWPRELVIKKSDGTPLVDPNWPDEFLFDISTPALRQANLKRVLPSILVCAKKGFDAVEFDNLDSFLRSEGYLNKDHAIAHATSLVKAAKENGLAAGQKNLAELGTQGRDEIGFSFVITEECHRWSECAAYTSVYGSQVINIEYTDDLRGTFKDVCADQQTPRATVLRDRLLSPVGDAQYTYRHC